MGLSLGNWIQGRSVLILVLVFQAENEGVMLHSGALASPEEDRFFTMS